MKTIRVIGNSTDSRRFYELIKKVAESNKIRIDLEWEDLPSSTAEKRYNVKKFPGLQINGKIVSEGKYKYSESEIVRLIR